MPRFTRFFARDNPNPLAPPAHTGRLRSHLRRKYMLSNPINNQLLSTMLPDWPYAREDGFYMTTSLSPVSKATLLLHPNPRPKNGPGWPAGTKPDMQQYSYTKDRKKQSKWVPPRYRQSLAYQAIYECSPKAQTPLYWLDARGLWYTYPWLWAYLAKKFSYPQNSLTLIDYVVDFLRNKS
jgi:hypothetical protein